MGYFLNRGEAGGQARKKKALEDPKNIELYKRICELKKRRFIYTAIADQMKKDGYRNSNGQPYDAPKLCRIYKMFKTGLKK